MFAGNAAGKNKLKFRRVRNTHSESEIYGFDEATPLTSDAENMTENFRNAYGDSRKRLSAREGRDVGGSFLGRVR